MDCQPTIQLHDGVGNLVFSLEQVVLTEYFL